MDFVSVSSNRVGNVVSNNGVGGNVLVDEEGAIIHVLENHSVFRSFQR